MKGALMRAGPLALVVSAVALVASVVALNLAVDSAFSRAPQTGDTSPATVAAQYIKDAAIQGGATVDSIHPVAIREHGNTAIVRERLSYHQTVFGIRLPEQTVEMSVRLRRSEWSARYGRVVR